LPSIAELLVTGSATLKPHSDTARLDTELLLAHSLDTNRTHLYTWPEKIPDEAQQTCFLSLLQQRVSGVPVAYLTGVREFWSMPFRVTHDTLVPRPETELIVELAVELLHRQPGPVLDLGTGSGVIAISIASEHPQCDIDAVDLYEGALDVARSNALANEVDVRFFKSSWYDAIDRDDYRLIVTNPPYIAEDDPHLQSGGLQYEPISALRAGDEGMADIAVIVAGCSAHLMNNGWLLVEHGASQGSATRQLMRNAGLVQVRTGKDLESRDRVTLGCKP